MNGNGCGHVPRPETCAGCRETVGFLQVVDHNRARVDARELSNPEKRRGYTRTAKLAGAVSSHALRELNTINVFLTIEVDARTRGNVAAPVLLADALAAASRLEAIFHAMLGNSVGELLPPSHESARLETMGDAPK